MLTKLNREAIETIEKALDAGYDVEIRKNKNGITIASISKKLVYKDNPTDIRESAKDR